MPTRNRYLPITIIDPHDHPVPIDPNYIPVFKMLVENRYLTPFNKPIKIDPNYVPNNPFIRAYNHNALLTLNPYFKLYQ